MYENPSEKAHFVIKILVSMATMLSKTVDKIVSHYLINYRHKIFLKPSDIQKHNFKIEVTKRLSKKTLSTGYHDNGPFLKLLLYQKLIGWPSSIYVPSFMLLSKSARLWQKTALISWTISETFFPKFFGKSNHLNWP